MAENAIEIEIQELLTKHRAVLVRDRKHLVYQFPDGKIFVTAKTPSDRRSYQNNLSDLKRVLGLTTPIKPPQKPRERAKKTVPNVPEPPAWAQQVVKGKDFSPLSYGLADQLRRQGFVETALREQITVLEQQCRILTAESSDIYLELELLKRTKAVRFVGWCKRLWAWVASGIT